MVAKETNGRVGDDFNNENASASTVHKGKTVLDEGSKE